MPAVRYLVTDLDRALAFYTGLGFTVAQRFGPAFASVTLGDLTLWLSAPASSAARPMPDGSRPAPGGWNRFVLEVPDLDARMRTLTAAGVRFRSPVITGPGGRQIVADDPDGNPVELFEPG